MSSFKNAVACCTVLLLSVAVSSAGEIPGIVPKPEKISVGDGFCKIDGGTVIYLISDNKEIKGVGKYLAGLIEPATGLKVPVKSELFSKSEGIILRLDKKNKSLGDEGYTLDSTEKGVEITASKPAGLFYGVQTLRQLLPAQIESKKKVDGISWQVPCVSIEDKPRFKWRGYLIDPARHFRPKDELKRYIDLLALHKMNIMQLHLTDDQGWRVEIKKYPKLIEVGSRVPNYGGQKGEGWFYSQADIRELVAYAAERYVTLVPEIEMPGHCGAALTSYPELACSGKNPGGWAPPLCVTKEATLKFATNVLDEVIALFPSPYIHVGADEVPAGPWRNCASCKAAMEELGKTPLPLDVKVLRVHDPGVGLPFNEDIGRLQGEFIRKIDRHLAARGRQMVGWDEILDGGLRSESSAVAMAWRGVSAVGGSCGQRREVIVSLHPEYYLDNGTSLQRTYDYEPVPKDLPVDQVKYVLGVQCNMWGEQTQSLQSIDRSTFPRLCAVAETGWSSLANRNFSDFEKRLVGIKTRLDTIGVNSGRP